MGWGVRLCLPVVGNKVLLRSVFEGYATIVQVGGATWHTANVRALGQITITSLAATRIKAAVTFLATPSPLTPAEGTLVATAGQFDMKVEGAATAVPRESEALSARSSTACRTTPLSRR